jgi:hypothetical protein
MKRIISLSSWLILLSSCTAPPDVSVCRSLTQSVTEVRDSFGIPVRTVRANPMCVKMIGEPQCGYCVWTISSRVQYVGESEKYHLYGKPWSVILREMILMPSESYAKAKAYIIKNCKKHGDCNRDIDKWRIKLDSLDSIPAALGN